MTECKRSAAGKGYVELCCGTCYNVQECTVLDITNKEDCTGWSSAEEVCTRCKFNKGEEDVLRHPLDDRDMVAVVEGTKVCIYCKECKEEI